MLNHKVLFEGKSVNAVLTSEDGEIIYASARMATEETLLDTTNLVVEPACATQLKSTPVRHRLVLEWVEYA